MAVRLDAAADRLLRTANLINYAANYSGILWFYISSMPGNGVYATLFAIDDNSNDTDYIAIVGNAGGTANLVYGIQVAGTYFDSALGATNLAASAWYCLAFVRASSTSRTGYIGTLTSALASQVTLTQTDVTVPARTAPTRMEIGGVTSGNVDTFNGRVANIKLWTTNRTLAELQNEQWTIRPHFFDSLHIWSPTFPGATVRAEDKSGNGYNWTESGTLTDEQEPPISYGA